MARFDPPKNFDFSKPNLWQDWKERWETYHIASKLFKDDGAVQVASLVYAMGQQAQTIFKSFNFDDDEQKKDYAIVLKKFDDHFVPSVNVIYERSQFYSRNQKPNETVEAYIRALYELAENCQFSDAVKSENIRDRLVVGISDRECTQKLHLTADLTLQKAIEICRTSEQIKSQMAAQQPTANLDALQKRKAYKKAAPQGKPRNVHAPQNRQQSQQETCGRCGYIHRIPNRCPAHKKQCAYCKKMGHFAKVCRAKNAKSVHEVEYANDGEECEEPNLFLGEVASNQSAPWQIYLQILNQRVQFKVDSGADVTCIPKSVYDCLRPKPTLVASFIMLQSPAGSINVIGKFNANVQHKSQSYTITVHVIESKNVNCLLSRPDAFKMGMLKFIEEINDDLFSDYGLMNCEPVKLKLKNNATPYHLNTPRRVPEPLMQPVKEELDKMVAHGIISPVTEPTEWCAPMVVALKKNNKVRICVDLKKLNHSVQRERYLMPTIDELAARLANSKVFTTIDCSQAFWSIPLHEDSRKYTCFITPYGRYIFNRLPYGLNTSTEIFQRNIKEKLAGIPNVEVNVDDLLIHAPTTAQHDETLEKVVQCIKNSGLKLNKSKCKFRQSSVVYNGQLFTAEGMSPDPSKVEAIQQLQPPKNVSEVRTIVGMVNYLARYVPDVSKTMQPILELMKSDVLFTWGSAQQNAFDEIKKLLASDRVLAYYDMTRATYVAADSSSYGIGAVLLQDFDGSLKPIAYASKSLTQSERKWAQIDKECYALVWACERFQHYLVGLPEFTLLTDHKPLVPLINDKDLDKTPIRIQRLLMRLLRFNCVAQHIPGKQLVVADTLSRHSTSLLYKVDELTMDVIEHTQSMREIWPITDAKLQEIANETARDPDMSLAMTHTLNGWPAYAKDVPVSVQPYYGNRENISTTHSVLTFQDRIVIPPTMRQEILNKIHAGHQGIVKCRQIAQAAVWWPTINVDIADMCKLCTFCDEHKPSKPNAPLMPTVLPSRAWEKIGADLFEYDKKHYLVVIDYYSRYIEVIYLPDMTSKTVIYKLKSVFARFGIPAEIRTDGAKNFVCREFTQFSIDYGFNHKVSSPYHSQSNGEAEAAVKIAKSCLRQEDPFLALLYYRSTPHSATGVSPAQLMFGRQIRTLVPMLPDKLKPNLPNECIVRDRDRNYKDKAADYYNKRHGVRPAAEFSSGDNVRTKLDNEKVWKNATVINYSGLPRSYMIQTDSGTVIRRNAKHIMPTKTMSLCKPESNSPDILLNESFPKRSVMQDTANKNIQHPDRPNTPKPILISLPTKTYHSPKPIQTRSGRIVRKPEKLSL